jgi:hypothetical protein
MFSTKNANATDTNTPMKAGHEVVATFTGAEVEEGADKGNLIFNFKNNTGSLKYRMFNIDRSNYPDADTDRVKHLASAFLGSAAVDAIEAASFEAWALQVASALEAHKGTECKLHVVIDKNKYTTLAKFRNVISTEKQPCSWISDPNYHKYEFVAEEADVESDNAASFQGTDSTTEVEF